MILLIALLFFLLPTLSFAYCEGFDLAIGTEMLPLPEHVVDPNDVTERNGT